MFFNFSCRSDVVEVSCCFDSDLVILGLFIGFDLVSFLIILQVRIQLGQGSAASVTREMLKNEGFGAFYKVRLLFPIC